MKNNTLGNYTIETLQTTQNLVSKYKMKTCYCKLKIRKFPSYNFTYYFQLSCICAMVLLSKSNLEQAKATTGIKIQFVTKFSFSEYGSLNVLNGVVLQSFDPS